ncbi:MAG: hypothetical protein AAF899_07850 [Pseudomonadota bacterium]
MLPCAPADAISVSLFLFSPGLMLVANGAVCSEPFSVAFAILGVVFWALLRVAEHGHPAPGVGRDRAAAALLLLTFAGTAIATLAYITVTMRYRTELWPILAVLSVGALPWLASARRFVSLAALFVPMVVAFYFTTLAAWVMVHSFGVRFSVGDWTVHGCARMAERRGGLSRQDIERTCRAPDGYVGTNTYMIFEDLGDREPDRGRPLSPERARYDSLLPWER